MGHDRFCDFTLLRAEKETVEKIDFNVIDKLEGMTARKVILV